MKKSNIEQIIKELARDNFRLYTESYPLENNLASLEACENLSELAMNYWNSRDESEIERDRAERVILADYFIWIQDAFNELLEH